MKTSIAVIASVAAFGVTGCGIGRDAGQSPGSSSLPGSTSPAPPSVAAHDSSTADAAAGLFVDAPTDGQPAGLEAAASQPTILLPVPPLPADMDPVRPSTSPTPEDPHDHDLIDGDRPAAAEVAVAWITALFTGRYDDPPDSAASALRPLAASDAVVAEALAAVTFLDVAGGETRWPYISEISEAGAGWWEACVLIKSTRFRQVGPSSTPVTIRVHVTDDGLIDDWELTP